MTSATSDLGLRIRALRRLQKRTLQEIATACGFTISLLSKIESGKTSPPIATLEKIAHALGLSISDLFNISQTSFTAHTSANQLAQVPPTRTDKGYGFHLLAAERADKLMQPFVFTAEKGKVKKGGLSHHGEEFIYVLDGEMNYRVGSTTYHLKTGDSLYFNSEEEHDIEPLSARVRYLAVFLERPEAIPRAKNSTRLNKKKKA